MQPDSPKLLWDAKEAVRRILRFAGGRTIDDDRSDDMLRAAIERQFTILGEALGRLRQVDPMLAARITDLPRAVALRNLLVHAYAEIDDDIVWAWLVGTCPRCWPNWTPSETVAQGTALRRAPATIRRSLAAQGRAEHGESRR